MKDILIIDDDTYICSLLENYFQQNGLSADSAFKASGGLELLKKNDYRIALCDYRLPDSDGMELLHNIRRLNARIKIIIMTAYADVNMAVKLIKAGALDYVTKPIQPEEILELIKEVIRTSSKEKSRNTFDKDFVSGKSVQIQEILKHAKIVAPTDMTVLIQGETGSGKEYIARAIHFNSHRSNQPFVAVDCGAIPRDLANSELFGHVKGAFTGAVNNKVGFFEYANGGTLFLDEIGNLSYDIQVKILRVLQERIITKVGDKKNIEIDVRIIVASNEDLWNEVNKNNFREDLYHRVNEFKINLPPLRHRKDDILIFAEHFREQANANLHKKVEHFSPEVEKLFLQYPWKGNLRELRNVVKRGVLLTDGDTIKPESLPDELRNYSPEEIDNSYSQAEGLKKASVDAERQVIINALKQANNNKSKAAKMLNIDRKTLYNKIKHYGIQAENNLI
ncbi:MAG: sigma-54 dependent transcriptional regulator [Bacteroidales bacterium]|nr:sigma-54 dependent transcriptional regulator [Bacteroidales bacterium]